MPVQTPAWFDASYYASQKIEQMNLTKYLGRTDWDMASYSADLASNNRTPYEDFLRSNDIHNLSYTNISPNRLFNVAEYLTALAEFANESGYSWPGYKAGEWTAQKAMEHMFNDYHVSAWDHFTLAGQYDLVNPSNSFDITAYYQQLTAWRNAYVDPETGITGWEGRTNWTLFDVLEDNIWAEVNPVEGLYTEAAGSGIYASAVPVDERVTVESGWNPWISTDQPAPPSDKPGYNPGGSLTPPSWDDGPDSDEPDAIVSVNGETAGRYVGEDGENTLFEAKDGLNPDSVLVGGEQAKNTLKVNLSDDFGGFNGVANGDSTDPSLTNIQTVTLVNGANGAPLSFSGKNTAGVQNWNIENGPVSLAELPDKDVSVGLKNIQQADASVNIGFAANAQGADALTLNVDNVGTQTSEVEGSPLNVSAAGVTDVLINAAANSVNMLGLGDMTDATSVRAQGAGALSLASLGDKVDTVDASAMSGKLSVALAPQGAPAVIRGGSGADDTLTISQSGSYGGKWTGMENLLVEGNGGDVTVDGANAEGLSRLSVNRWTPETTANIELKNITAKTFSVEDSSYLGTESSTTVNGQIENLNFTARNPYDGQGLKTRDVVVEATPVGVNFTTNASKAAHITVEDGVSLEGQFYLSMAETVTIDGPGSLGGYGSLHVIAPNALEINTTVNDNSYAFIDTDVGHSQAVITGANNYIDLNGQTAAITDGASGNRMKINVADNGEIIGGGGADILEAAAMYNKYAENGGQKDMITVSLTGAKDEACSEQFIINTQYLKTSMAVTVNGYDASDAPLSVEGGQYRFAIVTKDEAAGYVDDFFGLQADNLQVVINEYKEIVGLYDAEKREAYGFAQKAGGEIAAGVRLTGIDDIKLAAHALGDDPYRREYIDLEKGKLEYTSEGPLPTTFNATVDGDQSTLVPGVKITGNADLGDILSVYLKNSFQGLSVDGGEDGYVKDVNFVDLWNGSGKPLEFNAENINANILSVSRAPLTVTNWSNPLNSLSLFRVQPDEAVTEADVTVNLTEEALAKSDGYLSLSLGECGTEAHPVKLAVDEAITHLTIWNGTVHRPDHIEAALYNWLDISSMQDVNNITVRSGGELTLYAHDMNSTEDVSINVEDPVSLLGELDFINTESLTLGGTGNLGNEHTALQVAAAKAKIVVEGNNDLPEYMKLKVDAAASFTCDGVIKGDTVDLDLSGVTGMIEDLNGQTMHIYARDGAAFKAGSGGSNVEIDAKNATFTGGVGDDTFFALTRASAKAVGNGGNDTFIAYAHNSSEATADVVKVDFTGVVNLAAHETFVINTYDPTAKVAMTINNFDANDSIEIQNVDAELLSFASVGEVEAKKLIKEFGFGDPGELVAVMNDDGICGYYSAKAQAAYGFAPYDFLSDSSDFVQTEGIAAVVKVTGIDDIEAKAAFSFYLDRDSA